MAKTILQIVIKGDTKDAKKISQVLENIGKESKKTSERLQAVKKANDDLTISFKRLFQIVFLYVGAFETLHKILNITGDTIATMINYNKELEKMMYGLATTLSMIANVEVGGRKLTGLQEYMYMLQTSKELVEEIRKKSMQAFVPMDKTVETFRAIVGFVLQAKGSLKDAVELSILFSQAVQALQLPMNQVVQEARDLLQGGIQPASSTLATILGINDKILNQWKEQGILLEKLKEKLGDLKYAIGKQFETLEGKLFTLKEYVKYTLGEGGKPLFQSFKFVINDLIQSLFIIEKKVKEIQGQKITYYLFKPKPEFVEFIRNIANSLSYLMLRFYAFSKSLYYFYKQNEEFVKTLLKIIKWFIAFKIALFAYRSFITSIISKMENLKNVILGLGTAFTTLYGRILLFVSAIFLLKSGIDWLIRNKDFFKDITKGLIEGKKIKIDWKKGYYAVETDKDYWKYGKITPFMQVIKDNISLLFKPFDIFNNKYFQNIMMRYKRYIQKTKQSIIYDYKGKILYAGETQEIEKLNKKYQDLLKTYDSVKDLQIELIKYYNNGNITLQERITILKSYNAILENIIKSKEFKNLDIQTQLDVIKRYNQIIEDIEKLKRLYATIGLEKQYTELDLTRMPLKDYYLAKIEIIDKLITKYREERRNVDEMSEKYLELTKKIKQLNEEKKQLIERYKEFFGTFKEGFRDALDNIYKQYTQYAIGIETISKLITNTQQYLAESLYKFVIGQLRSFKDFVKEFSRIVLRIIIEMITKLMVFKTFQFFGFTPFTNTYLKKHHSGGLVRKYHFGGLASDEVPAILQTGEYVVSRKGVEFLDKINRGQLPFQPSQPIVIAVNYNIQTLDSKSFEEYIRANKGAIIKPIIENIKKNGIFIKSIRSKI